MFDQLVELTNSSEIMEVHRGVIGIRKIFANEASLDNLSTRFVEKNLIHKFI